MSKAAIKKIERSVSDPSIELLLHHLVELDDLKRKLPALDGYYSFHHQLENF